MAEYAIKDRGVYSKTLAANTVDTLTFSSHVPAVEVTNKSGTASIYYTLDGSTPTVNGENCFELPAAVCARGEPTASRQEATVVKIISSGTPEYSVARTVVD